MKKKPFTLLELMAAMAVLVIFMLFVMRFFNTSQDVMNRSTGKTDQYERARIAMDLLSNDLQNLYYVEGFGEPVYDQSDKTESSETFTENLSFYAVRLNKVNLPDASGPKTGLSWITYHFDKDSFTLKTGIAGDDAQSKWGTALTGDDLGILADGVRSFRVIPCYIDPSTKKEKEITTPSDLSSKTAGSRWIPDYVRIELQLMDGETAAAIKAIMKLAWVKDPSGDGKKWKWKCSSCSHVYKNEAGVEPAPAAVCPECKAGTPPDALNPAKGDAFTGEDKVRTFSRIVEIDRGQY